MTPAVPGGGGDLLAHSDSWQLAQYGVLSLGILVFGWVILKLWQHGLARDKQQAEERAAMEKERANWALEREKVRLENEKAALALRLQLSKEFADDLEKQIDKFTDTLEKMSEATERQVDKQIATYEKLSDRIVIAKAPPSGRY